MTTSVENVPTNPLDDRAALMSKYSIGFDGRRYDFGEYHYDRLADAVAYAEAGTWEDVADLERDVLTPEAAR